MFFWLSHCWRLLSLGNVQTSPKVSLILFQYYNHKQSCLLLLSSVESADVDLSEYQDANGDNIDDTDDVENTGNGDKEQQNGAAEPASATAGTYLPHDIFISSSFSTSEP